MCFLNNIFKRLFNKSEDRAVEDIKFNTLKYLQMILENIDSGAIDPIEFSHFRIYKSKNIIAFYHRDDNFIYEHVPLKSLVSEVFKNHLITGGYTACLDEYNQFYHSGDYVVINHAKNIHTMLSTHEDIEPYSYTMIRYEITLITIYKTLIESISYNGEILSEIKEATIELLKSFNSEIEEVKMRIEEIEDAQLSAMNQNLLERLHMEKEYVKRN